MTMKTLALLNTSILTAYGTFEYRKISLQEAIGLCQSTEWEPISYIGHESTAQLLSTLLDVEVPMNRQAYRQEPGDVALVFKLNGRPPEGTILSLEDIQAIGYEFGLLRRTA